MSPEGGQRCGYARAVAGPESTDEFGTDADWETFITQPDPQHELWRAPSPGVGPVTALRLAWNRRDQFEGRASRSEYWWIYFWGYIWVLVGGGLSLGLALINFRLGTYMFFVFFLASVAVMIMSIAPIRALTRRRLHDAGRDRKWQWSWGLLPLAELKALLQRGERGPNRFGPGPQSPFPE